MSAVRTAPTPNPDTGQTPLSRQLRRRLLTLDYPAFARCICALLEALGYEDARPAGRKEWKGYNRPGGGGYDLEANLPGGLTSRYMIAQIKQYDALAVHQRSVDELRGACLRLGAAEALLITVSAFSEVVRKRAASPDLTATPVAPVRLIDGDELLGLLIRHRIGVRERVQGGNRRLEINRWEINRLEIDEAFFAIVSALPSSVPDTAAPTWHSKSVQPRWCVTIRVSSAGSPKTRNGRQGKDGLGKDGLGKGGR